MDFELALYSSIAGLNDKMKWRKLFFLKVYLSFFLVLVLVVMLDLLVSLSIHLPHNSSGISTGYKFVNYRSPFWPEVRADDSCITATFPTARPTSEIGE